MYNFVLEGWTGAIDLGCLSCTGPHFHGNAPSFESYWGKRVTGEIGFQIVRITLRFSIARACGLCEFGSYR